MPRGETVRVHGKDVAIRQDSTDSSREVLDYGTKLWWIEEGFPGSYITSLKDREESGSTCSAGLEFRYNGEIELSIAGTVFRGSVNAVRYYAEFAEAELIDEVTAVGFTIYFDYYVNDDLTEDYNRIEINIPEPPEGFPNDLFMTRK